MKVTSLYVMGGQQCTQRKIIWFQIPISLGRGGEIFSVPPSDQFLESGISLV